MPPRLRKRKQVPAVDMNSLSLPVPVPAPLTNPETPRQIPLLCHVCPENPRFSDVSHLLTHIASKGHLHHETQTKLKAHQDLNSSLALQLYEQWYKDHDIEALLVGRMKAKQDKETARARRGNVSSSVPPAKARKKPKRTSSDDVVIKTEQLDFDQDPSIFPGFFLSDNETEIVDDVSNTADAMSLKGQVWPGMGKMDLANEEMKRTRNQRKPKSVVERMRKTSEGIEPTQVVMTPDFQVERVKGVYDEDSPVSDQEEPTPLPPRKSTRTRRKKPTPLTEIPVNIPRGRGGRAAPNGANSEAKLFGSEARADQNMDSMSHTPYRLTKSTKDMFRDEGNARANQSSAPQYKQEHRFDLRDRLPTHTFNPISQATLASPTPPCRDVPARLYSGPGLGRPRSHGTPYFGSNNSSPVPLAPFPHHDNTYSFHDGSVYANHTRLPFSSSVNYNEPTQEQYRQHSNNHVSAKQIDHDQAFSDDVLGTSGHNLFLSVPGCNSNPLHTQDRMLVPSYSPSAYFPPIPPMDFTPVERTNERDCPSTLNHGSFQHTPNGIKMEAEVQDNLSNTDKRVSKGHGFNTSTIWSGQGSENDLDVQERVRTESFEL